MYIPQIQHGQKSEFWDDEVVNLALYYPFMDNNRSIVFLINFFSKKIDATSFQFDMENNFSKAIVYQMCQFMQDY